MTASASFPQFTRLLKRYWGADLSQVDPANPDPKQLYQAIAQQSAMIQQLVEELASFMGKTQEQTLYAPLTIKVDGTQQGDTDAGVPTKSCGEGWGALTVQNYGSQYNTTTKMVTGGHAAIFDGVISADAICTRFISITDDDGEPIDEIGQASYITFQLNGGWLNLATVLDYFNGTNPGAAVQVGDPNGIFPDYLSNAKGRAFYYPAGDYYVAVECEESSTGSTSGTLNAGCGIDITGAGTMSVNNAQLAGYGLVAAGTCSLDVDFSSGLQTGASGLAVCLSSGLDFNSVGCIALDLGSGTTFDTSGGLTIDPGSGLTLTTGGKLNIDPGSGTYFGGDGSIRIKITNNFYFDGDDLGFNAGSGLGGGPGSSIGVNIDHDTIQFGPGGDIHVDHSPNSVTVTGVVVGLRINGVTFEKKTRELAVLRAEPPSGWTPWAIGTNCATA